MASSNNKEIISRASPHTQKKFELIENYIMPWAQKLMNNNLCHGLIFIDCMSNSGVYHDDNNCEIEGTPLRVARILRNVAGQYPSKQISVHFNDIDKAKTDLLSSRLPSNSRNFNISVTNMDANELLRSIGPTLDQQNLHYFLLYDPYDAHIDWGALLPFFRHWGEVMINHMVSDSIRAIKCAKSEAAKEKYEGTYLTDFENLVPFGSDKAAYEKRIKDIILQLKGYRRYYIAAFPFYNSQNAQMYSLIHCTSNAVGFELFKTKAWQTFGAQSSNKDTHGSENQLAMSFDDLGTVATVTDESCFHVSDIAKYIQGCFVGKQNILLEDIWKPLSKHPVYPLEGYKKQIRQELKDTFGVQFKNVRNPRTGRSETRVSFAGGAYSK